MSGDRRLFGASRLWVKCVFVPLVIFAVALGGQRPSLAQLAAPASLACAALVLCLAVTFINFGDDGYQELIASLAGSTRRFRRSRVLALSGFVPIVAVAVTLLSLVLARDTQEASFQSVLVMAMRVCTFGLAGVAVGLLGDRHVIARDAVRILVIATASVVVVITAAWLGLLDEGTEVFPNTMALVGAAILLKGTSVATDEFAQRRRR